MHDLRQYSSYMQPLSPFVGRRDIRDIFSFYPERHSRISVPNRVRNDMPPRNGVSKRHQLKERMRRPRLFTDKKAQLHAIFPRHYLKGAPLSTSSSKESASKAPLARIRLLMSTCGCPRCLPPWPDWSTSTDWTNLFELSDAYSRARGGLSELSLRRGATNKIAGTPGRRDVYRFNCRPE